MMMLVNRVIISAIVCTEKCPTLQVTVVFVTCVKDVAMEIQRITSHTQHKNTTLISTKHQNIYQ